MLIKILVVDDSASDRLIIKNMLSEYTVLTACDGIEALRVLAENDEINLLILDLNMDSLKASIDVHVALLQAQQALEQKIDEQALTFDMVFDQAPIGIAISHSRDPKRSDKNNIKINSAFEQITGRTKEELIDSGWAKISYRRYEKLYCQQGGINREN